MQIQRPADCLQLPGNQQIADVMCDIKNSNEEMFAYG